MQTIAAVVAQMVERGKTGLGKGLDSNIFHLRSALSRVRVPSWQHLLKVFLSQSQAYCCIGRNVLQGYDGRDVKVDMSDDEKYRKVANCLCL